MKREKIETLLEEIDSLLGGLLDDFDEGRDCGAAVEALHKLHEIIEIFDAPENN